MKILPGKMLFITLLILFLSTFIRADETQLETLGGVGAGIFLPTGSDGDVADKSPAFQLNAVIGFGTHLGLEAEFLYVPVLLKESILSNAAHRKGTQLALVGGLRLATGRFLNNDKGHLPLSSGVGYLALRAGFARISIRSDSDRPVGGWIGRPVDELENPAFIPSTTTITRQKGLVLSPRTGVLFRVSNRTALDLAFTPLFIFDRGDVSTQFFLTLSISRATWQNF